MLESLKTQQIKFTSASVWRKRENPGEYWNGKEWTASEYGFVER